MSKAAYWQRGETLDYKNTGSSVIEANTIIVFGSKIGIAGMEINPGETGSLHISGTFEFPKATGAIAQGQMYILTKQPETLQQRQIQIQKRDSL